MAITGFFGFQLQYLSPDFEFEKFFPTDDPDIAFYEEHLESFGYDNDYLLVVVGNNKGIFKQSFLTNVEELTGKLQKLHNIKQVINPVTFKHLVAGPLGVIPFPLIHVNQPEKYPEDSAKVYSQPIYSSFFSDDGKLLMIQLIHEHLQDPVAAEGIMKELNLLLSEQRFDQSYVIGKLVAQQEFIDLIKKDFLYFLIAALTISFLALVLIFRSLKTALLPYAISLSTLIWLLGLMAFLGVPITIVGSLIPPVILFVSSSDAIHFINAYRGSEEKAYLNRLKASLKKVILPTFLTSITTAIGFFSLITITTDPIRDLGIYTGIGVLFAFIITFFFGPLLINKTYKKTSPSALPRKFVLWLFRHQKSTVATWLLIVCVSGYGLFQLRTDAYLLKDLPDDSPVRQHFNLIDTHFGGSKPWELAYWPNDSTKSIWDQDVMTEAQKIQKYLESEYPIERLLSPVSILNYGNQMINGGLSSAFKFPDQSAYNSAYRVVKQFTNRNDLPKLINEQENYGRFVGFIPQYGSRKTIRKDQALKDYIKATINPDILTARLTGTTYLIDKSHALLSQNLLKGLLIAIGVISLLLGLYFKSIKILIISMLANILPLLFTGGFMGLTGISLQLTTSIIFAVAFGIAVDDTIHLVAVYLQQKRNHKNRVLLLTSTLRSAGQAIVITSLVIVAGFGLFIFSSFGATYYLGLFMSIALLVALLADLTVLPILLHHFSENKSPHK